MGRLQSSRLLHLNVQPVLDSGKRQSHAKLPSVPKPVGRAAAVVPASVVGLSTFRGFAPDAFRDSATDILGAEDDLAALEWLNG